MISGFVSGIGCIIILLQLPLRGQHVLVAGLQPGVTRILERLGTLTLIPPAKRFHDRSEALGEGLTLLTPPQPTASP